MPIKKNLQRFHDAQAGEERISYEIALAELQAGAKKNCWIWYIFPQLETEKLSETSKYYGICNFNEACDYLQDPVLFERYKTMVALVKDKLEKGTTVLKLMGKPIDAKKLASSLTLFREAASYLALLNDELSPEYKVLEDNCTDIFKIISKQN